MSPAPNPRRGAHASPRSRGRVRRIIDTALLTVVAALVVLVALSGIGGTYAYWADQQTVPGAVLSSGTAALSITWTDKAPSAPALLPGETARRGATLKNTGDVPLEITASIRKDIQGFAVSATARSCQDRAETAALSTAPSALTGSGTNGRPVVLNPGDTVPLCVSTQATTTLKPGQTASFTLTLDGKQVQ